MKKRFGLVSILMLCATLLFAQKFTASVSKSNVGVGEQFEVDFSMNASGTHFTPPGFNNFQVVSGPNMASDMTSVNGNNTINITYSYILAAAREGTFTIDAAAIVINGHTLVSSPVKVTVKGQAPPVQKQPQQAIVPDDNNTKADFKDISKQIFIRAVVDKTNAYVGEQIKVNYKIYTRVDILGGQPDKAPELNGFWNQDVISKSNAPWKSEVYKGLRYNVTTIKQSILFPQHAGNLSIDPLSVSFGVRLPLPAVNILGSLYNNYRDVAYKAKSQPVIIHAVALPDAGKPAGFSGAVGSFSLYTDADKKVLKANETLDYTAEISGTGNLSLINPPNITLPPDIEKYDPKTTDRITTDSNGVSGSRKFSYLLIPRHQGDFTLNPAAFTYFNPATRKYVTLQGKPFSIKVNKGDALANAPAFNSSEQQDIKLLGNDIRYIKTSAADLYREGEGFYGSVWFYMMLFLGPVLLGGAVFYRRRMQQYNSDAVKVKSRGAGKMAAKHLANAQKELATGNKSAFYEAVTKGLYGYLGDKLNIPVADQNKENIVTALQSRNLDAATIRQLTDTMDLCEMARFAPVTGISAQQVLDQAKNTINEIEQKL